MEELESTTLSIYEQESDAEKIYDEADRKEFVHKLLRTFTKQYIKQFEKELSENEEKASVGAEPTVGKKGAILVEGASIGTNAGTTAVTALTKVPGLSQLATVSKLGVGSLIKHTTGAKSRFKAKQLHEVFRSADEEFKTMLAQTAVDLFQVFECQFVNITDEDNSAMRGMDKLAKDAVERTMNYINEVRKRDHDVELSRDFLAKAALLGKSKHASGLKQACGYSVKMEGVEWKTSDIYQIKGRAIIDIDRIYYYGIADVRKSDKCHYRLLLSEEKLEESSEKPQEKPLEEYKYLLNADDIERQLDKILEDKLQFKPLRFDIKEATDLFTGRDKVLKDIRKSITDNQILVLSGLGGVGKTETIRKYISLFSQEYDHRFVWINAESYETLCNSFDLLRKQLNIRNKDSDERFNVDDIYRYFSKGKCLFIFDNAEKYIATQEDDAAVEKFIPLYPFRLTDLHIIITSRNQEWGDIKVIKLDEWTDDEAARFVHKSLKYEQGVQTDDIANLTKILHNFPLALNQALSYIRQMRNSNNTNTNWIEYYINEIEKFKENNSVSATWNVTMEKMLNDLEYGPLAKRILDISSYISADDIDQDLFSPLIYGKNLDISCAVNLLQKFSLVKSNPESNAFSLHRLVQEQSRREIRNMKMENEIIMETLNLLKLADVRERKLKITTHFERLISHIKSWISVNTETKKYITETVLLPALIALHRIDFVRDYNYKRAKNLAEQIIEIKTNQKGSGHPDVLYYMDQLALNFGKLGNIEKRREMHEEVLCAKRQYFNENHEQVALTMIYLAKAYNDLGNYEKARGLLEQALKMQQNLGIAEITIAKTMQDLAGIYHRMKDLENPKRLLTKSLEIHMKYLGREHIETALVLNDLGNLYYVTGCYIKSKELYEEVLEIMRDYFGRDHTKSAITMTNLGLVYRKLGYYQLSKKILTEALEIRIKSLREEDVYVGYTLMHLALTLRELGNIEKCKELLQQVKSIIEQHFGNEHFEYGNILDELAHTHRVLADYSTALELWEECLGIYNKYESFKYEDIINIKKNLVEIYKMANDECKSQEWAKSLEISLNQRKKIEMKSTDGNKEYCNINIGHPELKSSSMDEQPQCSEWSTVISTNEPVLEEILDKNRWNYVVKKLDNIEKKMQEVMEKVAMLTEVTLNKQ